MESPRTLVQTPAEPAGRDADRTVRRRIAAGGRDDGASATAGHAAASVHSAASVHHPAAWQEPLLLGRYRMLEELGSGGFGVVWRAYDELLRRDVAVKRVWLGTGGGPIDSERATREALATARLSHPAIVALHEAFAHEGAFYLISELVDGDTLAQLIAEDALEDEEVLEIGLALASALVHAHARGVIHRDIKPHNVLVPHPPVDGAHASPALVAAAKLTDFGGASLVGEEVLTRTGDVLGTLAYMAPEQSEGREAGAGADLYSLALVLYEALCGTNPVRGATPASTARRIGRELPPLARARRDLPPALTRALARALAPAPQQRGTLEELRAALEDTLERGLARPRWRRGRGSRTGVRAPARTAPTAHQHHPGGPARWAPPRAPQAAPQPRGGAWPSALPRDGAWPSALPRDTAWPNGLPRDGAWPNAVAQDAPEPVPAPPPGRAGARLPRGAWLAVALVLVVWQALAGRPGVALLVAAALAPLVALSGRRAPADAGLGWLSCALAPALGCIGLAAVFPALAGQGARWRERAGLGALAYWWLVLAEPLLGRRLWLGPPVGMPARHSWEGSLSVTAAHVLGPLLALGVLLGALLWAVGAAALPWLVRGHSAVRDAIAAGLWTAALALATPALDAGLAAGAARSEPRGAVFGAVLAALVAVGARAVRGPV